jgi:hypothetical protein
VFDDIQYVVKFSNGKYYQGGYTSGDGTDELRYAQKYTFDWQPQKDLYLRVSVEENDLMYEVVKVKITYDIIK